MGRFDWYRRSTWDDSDREEFEARLKRCRYAGSKAQYLRIQAHHLAEVGLHTPAIELLDRLLRDFPDRGETAMSRLQKAGSLASLGELSAAIEEFRAALQAEREYPNVRTLAALDFGWFIVEKHLVDLFDEAADVLKEFENKQFGTAFPVVSYRVCAIQSILADARGDRAAAGDYARRALVEAAKTHSGYRYHAKTGLVESRPDWMEKRLTSLADESIR